MLRKIFLSLATGLFMATPITAVHASRLPSFTALSAEADPYTGSANFGVPIEVPPGRGGIQPNIQLQYNSNLPNGILGVGWSLELGSIQHSTHKGVPSYADSDEFVLIQSGGNQELVFDATAGFYRVKQEGAFMRVQKSGDEWVATDKKGIRYRFGSTPDAREYDPDNTSCIFKWYLNSIEDLSGNTMTITYWRNANKLYLQYIDYTSNPVKNLSSFTRVAFVWVPRNDQMSSYAGRFKVDTNYRLERIDASVENQLQYRFVLNYHRSDVTGRSLLDSITQYDKNGITSLPPLGFQYQESIPVYTMPTPIADGQFSGDFNGDGRMDRGAYISASYVKIALSSGSSFQGPETWLSGISSGQKLFVGNFDGDSFTDLCVFTPSSGRWEVFSSNGTDKFVSKDAWISGFGTDKQPGTGDFNGDGLTDVVYFDYDGISRKSFIALNAGGYFQNVPQAVVLNDAPNLQGFTGDFNGDGLTDLGVWGVNTGFWEVRLNPGNLQAPFQEMVSFPNFGAGQTPLITDFNLDGLLDIGYYDGGSRKAVYRLSNGKNAFGPEQSFVLGFSQSEIQTADFNGDSLPDFVAEAEAIYAGGTFPDLLRTSSNGIGGVTTIEYTPSTRYLNTLLPFVLHLVKSVNQANSRGDVYTTKYDYSGGLWDGAKREFRGFAFVEATTPGVNYIQTWFLQDEIFHGRIKAQHMYESINHQLVTKVQNTWQSQEIASGVQFVYLAAKNNFVYEGNASGRRTAEEFYYEESPQYGNLTRAVQLGEVDLATGSDVGSDKRSVEATYVNNTSNWLMGLPKQTTVRDNAGDIVRQTWFYYDNQGNTATPLKGLLTEKEDRAGTGNANPVTQYSYDTIGNLLTTTDPKGNVTRVTYDPTYNMFPLTTENALGHKVINEYFGVNGVPLFDVDGLSGLWGQLRSTTDPNQQQGRRSYDTFGRRVMTVGPLDSVAYPTQTTAIEYFSDYTKVTSRQRIKSGQPETLDTVSFYDGLGRLIQTKTPTEVAGQYVVSGQAEYNSSGLVSKKYLPFFSTNTVDTIEAVDPGRGHSTIECDAMGRPAKTINPDGTYASVAYDDWTTTTTDENGHMQKSYFDAYGRLVKKEEYTGADGRSPYYPAKPYTLYAATLYLYDSEGNLLKTIDAYGNTTTITYDVLGRKIAMDDPDMGYWTYEYDLNGNLTKQTDAKGQTLTFAYDTLNRLINKTDGAGGTVNVNYAYDSTSVANSKGRLTQAAYTAGNTQFAYDELGRESQSIKEINSQAYGVSRGYDALNNILRIQYPDQKNIYYKHNAAGQIEAISNDATILPQSFNWDGEKAEQLAYLVYRIPYSVEKRSHRIRTTDDEIRNTKTFLLNLAGWFERHVLGVGEAYAQAALTDSFKQESSSNGLVSIEAENYNGNVSPAAGTPTWDRVTTAGQSGTASLKANPNSGVNNDTGYTTKSPRLDYKIKFVKTGTHYVWIRGIGASGSDDSLHAGLDGQALTTSDRMTGFTTSWTWSKTTADASAAATINVAAAGEHTLNLWMREDGMVIDKVVVTSSSSYTPSGTGPAESPQFPPIAPVLNTAVPGDAQVSLSWGAVTGATGYKVKYGATGGTYTTTLDAGNVTSYSAAGLTNGKTYYFVVVAYNAAGTSANSNEKSAVPAVSLFTVTLEAEAMPTKTTGGTTTGGWNIWSNGYIENTVTFPRSGTYEFEIVARGSVAAGVWPNMQLRLGQVSKADITVNTSTWKSFIKQVSVVSGSHRVAVAFTNDYKTTTEDRNLYVDKVIIREIPPPAAPVLSTATAGDGQVTLAWSAAAGATGYKVYYGTASGTYGTPLTLGNVTTTTVTGLSNGTKYYFAVGATNSGGESVKSNEMSAMPAAPVIESPTLFIKNVDYNAAGQITKIEYGNGDVTTYTYDPLTLRLSHQVTSHPSQGTIQDLSYSYDSVGNILSITDAVNTASQTFQYDELNRLMQATGQSYGTKTYVYDEIGNIVEKDGKTYFYGDGVSAGPHAVTSLSDGTTFSYDANGNMVTKVEAGVTTAYSYDAENRLIKVVKNGSTIGQYEYDGDGGRTKKTATVGSTTTTTTFVGSLFETSGARSTKFIFLGDQRVASVTASPTLGSEVLYYHADHLGGTNVLSNADGTKKELIEYEPFGLESRHEKYGSSEEVAWYYFTGKPKDDETGLIYFGARYYDPSLGRFITPDLLVQAPGNPQTFNRYTYANNNPVNLIDPSGHGWFKKFWGQVVSAVVGIVTTIATGGNFVLGFQAYSLTSTLIGTGQALANGASPGRVFGSLAAGIAIGLGGAGLGIGDIGNLGLRMGAFAVQGATMGAASSAIMGTSIGEGAAWGAGFGAATGFVTSQQVANWKNHGEFVSNKTFSETNRRVSDLYDSIAGRSSRLSGETAGFDLISGEGHTGMTLDGQSFGKYPDIGDNSRASWILGKSRPGAIKGEDGLFVSGAMSASTKVNTFQMNRIIMQANNPGTFALAPNCAQFALDTSRFIGMNVPSNLTTFGITNPAKVAAWLVQPASAQEGSFRDMTAIPVRLGR